MVIFSHIYKKLKNRNFFVFQWIFFKFGNYVYLEELDFFCSLWYLKKLIFSKLFRFFLFFGGHLGFSVEKIDVRYTLNLANIYSCLGNIISFSKSIMNLPHTGGGNRGYYWILEYPDRELRVRKILKYWICSRNVAGSQKLVWRY